MYYNFYYCIYVILLDIIIYIFHNMYKYNTVPLFSIVTIEPRSEKIGLQGFNQV